MAEKGDELNTVLAHHTNDFVAEAEPVRTVKALMAEKGDGINTVLGHDLE